MLFAPPILKMGDEYEWKRLERNLSLSRAEKRKFGLVIFSILTFSPGNLLNFGGFLLNYLFMFAFLNKQTAAI